MPLGRQLVRLLLSLLPALVPAHVEGKAATQSAEKKPAPATKAAEKKPAPATKSTKKDPAPAPASKTTKTAQKPAPASKTTKKKTAPAPARARVETKAPKSAKPAGRTRQQVDKQQAKATQSAPKRPNPFLEVPAPEVTEASPAYTYANLDNEAAYAELDRRGIPYQREEPGPSGVRAPIRLTGTLHGVEVHSTVPPMKRATTHYEILDARLALALDDFCALLAEREIVELVHYTMYRPGASPRADSDSLPTRHPGGLAIDLGALRRKDGKWLDVREVWSTDIGKKTCGAGAKRHEDDRARELVTLVCDAAERRLFHYMLTPHFDQAHHDHLHLEIKPAVKWFLVN